MTTRARDHRSGVKPITAIIDLDAVAANVRCLSAAIGPAQLMAVVKANGYGHGMVEIARAATGAGAPWLGVAELDEALVLRAAGISEPILFWLHTPGEDFGAAIDARVDIGISTLEALDGVRAAAAAAGTPARVHVKIDTGLGRNGATAKQWGPLIDAVRAAEKYGLVEVVGVFSHLACADEPEHPSIDAQNVAFVDAVNEAGARGVRFEIQHLANTPGVFASPALHYDMVRAGLGLYGLSPFEGRTAGDLGLVPALRLVSPISNVKRVPAGHGVSYGLTYRCERETTLALVAGGYGDGIPRTASNRAEVSVHGVRYRIVGRVAMDQFVIDVGDDDVHIGDEAVLIGSGPGEPTAEDWARATDTINYEVVTRLSARIDRRYVRGGRTAAAGRAVDSGRVDG
ncbi:alanine racemase [Spelaeicoccus albus]|uniref:Alanine racemase n=1 Tax=Spelaeicoccus albus TaxID=1280376 RepID=A0A7Z0CYY6_9MICO|nr:alanine racemase [Spelaeicoccus albus]NYI65801.1 alanine racemase [Spelaeicoccus albus]